LSDTLQAAPYQGFVELPEARVAKVVATYGSVEEFVARRFFDETQTPTNFVLLRSNESSHGKTTPLVVTTMGAPSESQKIRIGTARSFEQKGG